MLNILLMDSNYYQTSGLRLLITNQLVEEKFGEVYFLLPSEEMSYDIANIIFQDDRVTIQINNQQNNDVSPDERNNENKKIILHIPFLTRNQTLNEISMKIGKILAISRSEYKLLLNKEYTCRDLGLNKYAQLSDTENNVMILIGQGYNSTDISRILNRSRKTISTHYRNASRKMGVVNRAEFYRLASFIARCGHDERNILCL